MVKIGETNWISRDFGKYEFSREELEQDGQDKQDENFFIMNSRVKLES